MFKGQLPNPYDPYAIGDEPQRGHCRHGGRGRGGRGGYSGRGRLRVALLAMLAEDGPQTGSELLQKLAERRAGRRAPSPASIYPALQLLEDDGLITGGAAPSGSGRSFELSEAGRAFLEKLESDPGVAVPGASENLFGLRRAVIATVAAARQVGFTGNSQDVAKATALFDEARRGLYRLLAQNGEPGREDTGTEPSADGE